MPESEIPYRNKAAAQTKVPPSAEVTLMSSSRGHAGASPLSGAGSCGGFLRGIPVILVIDARKLGLSLWCYHHVLQSFMGELIQSFGSQVHVLLNLDDSVFWSRKERHQGQLPGQVSMALHYTTLGGPSYQRCYRY